MHSYAEPITSVWPPDDTEESVVGTSIHQTTITNLRLGINGLARLRQAPDQPAPWEALTQIILTGFQRPDGSPYRTLPDVFVYPHPIDPNVQSVSIAKEGPPVLIVEVLSEATWETDVNMVRGKGYSYAQAGVQEYLVLDPPTQFIPEQVRAWRLEGGVYRKWESDAMGRWVSGTIGVAIGFEGIWATVYRPDGGIVPREAEIVAELAARDAEIERLRRLLRERGDSE